MNKVFVYLLTLLGLFLIQPNKVDGLVSCATPDGEIKQCTINPDTGLAYTNQNRGECRTHAECNCDAATLEASGDLLKATMCRIQKPNFTKEEYRSSCDKDKKECTIYDIGYIATWTKAGGSAWDYTPGSQVKRLVVFTINIPLSTEIKNLKIKQINSINPNSSSYNYLFNDIAKKYAVTKMDVDNNSFVIRHITDHTYQVAFYANVSLSTNGSNKGQNVKLPWQNDYVKGYHYYMPTEIVITYEDGNANNKCNYNNKTHFGVEPGVNPGTGPNGANCCDYYIDLYKDDNTKLNKLYKDYPICKTNIPGCKNEINLTNTCGSDFNFKDTNDWDKCIFADNEYRDTTIGNGYCPIYCREELKSNLPFDGKIVPAGQHFIYTPIVFNGTRECRTKVDLNKWKTDWTDADNRVKSTYDAYEIYKGYYNNQSSGNNDCSSCTSRDENGKCISRRYWDSKKYGPFYYDGQYYSQKKVCSGSGYTSAGLANAKKDYDNAVAARDILEESLKSCHTWEVNYDLQPDVSIEYGKTYLNTKLKYYGIVSNKNGNLVINTQSTNKENQYCIDSFTNNCVNNYGNDFEQYSYNCASSGCTKTRKVILPWKNRITKTIGKSINYQLNNSYYRYVLKPSGESVHKSDLSSEYKKNGNYYDVGYGNFPVHYTTSAGTYPIDLTYSKLGHNNHFDKYLKENPMLYACEYVVTNQMFGKECEEKNPPRYCKETYVRGLDLVYRVISLTDPFPNKDGKGRNPGENWIGNVEKYITNNRNVTTDEIYTKRAPMYEITLTPALIKEIRKYNDKTEYDDFLLECNSNGHECESKFIRKNFQKYFSGCGTSKWSQCNENDK